MRTVIRAVYVKLDDFVCGQDEGVLAHSEV
jgi:hypothetical protein